MQSARSVELLQDVTASHSKLQAALKDLDTPNPNGSNSGGDADDSGSGLSFGTAQPRRHPAV